MMRFLRPVPLQTRPRVSVVIPCYNYGRYLPDAVASVLDQHDVDVDVLIVDDASPDGSADVARGLAASDDRVRLLAHDRNMGHLATYNDGLQQVDGEYVVLLSADDLLAPGSLGRSVALLESRSDVAFVYGYAVDFTDRPPGPPRSHRLTWSVWAGTDWIDLVCRRGHNVVTNPEVVMRRQSLVDAGFYDPRQPHTADMYLWLRAACTGNVGRINGPHQAYYRVHQANMHLTDFAGVLTDIRQKLVMFDYFADSVGSAQGRRWGSTARRSLARQALRVGFGVADVRPGAGGPGMPDYAAFAERTWPEVTQTALWRAYERRSTGSMPKWRRTASALDRDLRNRLRWRRLRRYGT